MVTTRSTRRATRVVLVVVAVCALATGFASAAYAGIIAERSASISIATGTWSAKASSSSVSFIKKNSVQTGIFTVTNNGSLGLSGFSLTFSGTTGATSQLSVSACQGGSWSLTGTGGNASHTCSGTVADLGTATSGTIAVSTSLSAGSTVSLRVSGTGSGNAGGTTVSVKVAKSNAVSTR